LASETPVARSTEKLWTLGHRSECQLQPRNPERPSPHCPGTAQAQRAQSNRLASIHARCEREFDEHVSRHKPTSFGRSMHKHEGALRAFRVRAALVVAD